ncbi:MAG: glycogen synthase [Candidatus Eremiobacteraeota bacterium]|nr:glycogen synthase [Candidatus Eremiobacteraeota bacterium]
MKILFLAAEATPFIKVGGLGDVAGALPAALRRRGLDVRLMVPRYGNVDPGKWGLTKVLDNFPVQMDWRREECQLLASPDGQSFFLENQYFFGSRGRAYGEDDDPERFVLFARAAIEACRYLNWWPDVIHAHDWHSAAAIRINWAAKPRSGLVFTIHNIAHQGMCANSKWPLLGVYNAMGHLNLMEQAIYAADVITTVSPTYANEIRTREYGFGLDSILWQRSDRLVGILNGIDTDSWNPATDDELAANYDAGHLQGKARCKAHLQKKMGLAVNADAPLIGVVSRLDDQKGISLIVDSLGDILALTNAQLMVLGSGHDAYENAFRRATYHHPDRIANYIGFNAGLAREVYAGSDIFLMPSSFEPCGLSQMIAMRYGTLPVARATGGLVDTVRDRVHDDGVGYLFGPYDKGSMLWGLGRALHDYWDRGSWEAAMRRAMSLDFSWDRSAARYQEIYQRAVDVSR